MLFAKYSRSRSAAWLNTRSGSLSSSAGIRQVNSLSIGPGSPFILATTASANSSSLFASTSVGTLSLCLYLVLMRHSVGRSQLTIAISSLRWELRFAPSPVAAVSGPNRNCAMNKKIILCAVILPIIIIWHYIWFDSARRYVHAELAEQFIDLRTKEHNVVAKAIGDLDQGDAEMASKRLKVLSEVYAEDLVALEQSISTEGGGFESLLISKESMESLRQFVSKYSFRIEASDESH